MRESHSASSVHEFAREDSDRAPADPALVAKLQQAAKLANENCDRALALAHKLSAQLREAQSRINQLELEADGLVDWLRTETEAAVAKLQSDADARVARTKIEADARMERIKIEADDSIARAQSEANARIARMKIEVDERIARAEAEAKRNLERGRVEIENDLGRLKADLAQAELRADRAEKWLVMIRREIEERLMPSFVAINDRLTLPEAD